MSAGSEVIKRLSAKKEKANNDLPPGRLGTSEELRPILTGKMYNAISCLVDELSDRAPLLKDTVLVSAIEKLIKKLLLLEGSPTSISATYGLDERREAILKIFHQRLREGELHIGSEPGGASNRRSIENNEREESGAIRLCVGNDKDAGWQNAVGINDEPTEVR